MSLFPSIRPTLSYPLNHPGWFIGALFVLMNVFALPAHEAIGESQSRTETNCTIGMAKGDAHAECQVPIPSGCTVASFPGYDQPWADVSKGGNTSCQFDKKRTDWKTAIVGACEACKTERCTGRFIVMFNCSDNIPPANPSMPQKR